MSLLKIFNFLAMMVVFIGCTNKADENKSNTEIKKNIEVSRTVQLNPEQRNAVGLKIEEVRMQPIKQNITIPGKVDFDQRRLAHLTSRVAGRVEQVYAFLGDKVIANQLIATIYSQEYLTAQAEFLQAGERLSRVRQHHDSLDLVSANSIYESARKKLLVIGVREQDLKILADSRIPKTLLDVYTPLGGTVTETGEILGHTVDIGTTLFHIADLASVWVIIEVYEKDIRNITTNLEATVEMTAYHGETFSGKLTRIFDVVEEKTRTIKGRIEVENRNQKLKPGMFVSATILLKSPNEVLAVPASAIQRDGEERYVFIATNDSIFQKRIVRIGKETQDWVEIQNGVIKGEQVVTKGTFTLKSEFLKESFGEGE